jgi:sec-independent protein translocase protein TatA
MLGNVFSGWHLLVILGIVVLLFGATRLPAVAKGVGQSLRILKSESRAAKKEASAADDPVGADAEAVAAEAADGESRNSSRI